MQLHDLQPKTKRVQKKRVGRGGKRGKTSGRGMKGQKARAGHRIRPEVRDLIKKLPKHRGYGKNRARTINPSAPKSLVVNLSALEMAYESGEMVNPRTLSSKGVLSLKKGIKKQPVKILGTGELSKKLSISGCTVSQTAREKIERAGGTVLDISAV